MARHAGYYWHTVNVIEKVVSQQARTGATKKTPHVVKQNQFCRVTALTASEQIKATGQVMVGLHKVEMAFRNDITAKHQLYWQETGTLLNITGVMPSPTENEIEFLCASVVT